MNILKAALAGVALIAAGQALAQQGAPAAVTPVYIGVHYGQSTWRPGCWMRSLRRVARSGGVSK